jgi:hypothetical protein
MDTLIVKEERRDAPPLADFPDDVLGWNSDVIEKDIAKFRLSGDIADWAARYARCRKINEDNDRPSRPELPLTDRTTANIQSA